MTLVTLLAMRRISERMAARREGIPRPPIVLEFVQTQLFCMQTQPKRKINGVMGENLTSKKLNSNFEHTLLSISVKGIQFEMMLDEFQM